MASAAVPLLMTGLSALGGLFGNRAQTTKTTSNTNNTTDLSSNSGTSVNYDPTTLAYRDSILGYLGRYLQGNDVDLSGYKSNGLEDINRTYDNGGMGLSQSLAARGLNSSPVAANAMTQMAGQRAGAQTQFSNSVPMLAEQIRQQRLQQMTGFFSSLPVGQQGWQSGQQHQYGTTEQTQTGSGNMLGGGIGGLGMGLANSGLFGGSKLPQSNKLGSLGSDPANLYGPGGFYS